MCESGARSSQVIVMNNGNPMREGGRSGSSSLTRRVSMDTCRDVTMYSVFCRRATISNSLGVSTQGSKPLKTLALFLIEFSAAFVWIVPLVAIYNHGQRGEGLFLIN